MQFLFSGEGPTDLGVCSSDVNMCRGIDFLHGPWAMIVDQLVGRRQEYSPLDSGVCAYVPKAAIVARATELKAVRKKELELPGKKRGQETGYFFTNARVLARIALERQAKLKDDIVAVLFRDADRTASASRGLWEEKQTSMLDGFARDGFRRGVPMLPNPKSEAWLLCAVKKQYRNCASLEERSGKDDSPHSLKKEVERHFGHRPSREQLCQMVTDGKIDAHRIDMPSFRAFTDRLDDVI